jgi:2-dehydropantoate 2-reductase
MGRLVDIESPHINSVLALIQQLGSTQGGYPTFPEETFEDEVAEISVD